MAISLRSRWVFLPLILALGAVSLYFLRLSVDHEAQPLPEDGKSPGSGALEEIPKRPIYKDTHRKIAPPLPEYFPLAAKANSPSDLPPVPSWNRPPEEHVPEETRLYIGFTRFWPLLQQAVVSYIAAGWPPEDIYVVENTGTMDANKRGLLTVQNPFYLDYHRLTHILGVNVITTPSLQTFAQLQNFYLFEAIKNNLTYYFWSHMDVAVHSHEDKEPFRSLYMSAVDVIRETQKPDYLVDENTGKKQEWGIQFFAYDWLSLVNVQSFADLGGWDTMVGYYGTDCDMYSRLSMSNYAQPVQDAGMVYDVTTSMDDLSILYRRRPKTTKEEKIPEKTDRRDTSDRKAGSYNSTIPSPNAAYLSSTEEDDRGSENFRKLAATLEQIQQDKRDDKYRNSWQLRQNGGEGEPYYYDPDGFEKALQMTIEVGTKINEEKWGHKGCDIKNAGLKEGDQWRVEHDSTFDPPPKR
ncbi:MAG: hypothetical protein LQ338_001167 [Usnochroma carphineum]|nr:MAG: hypothetical protein LQ338_001167 [Usnochroma carphineum]